MSQEESFESIMARTISDEERRALGRLTARPEEVAAYNVLINYPNIAEGTALYDKGVEIETAYLERGGLVSVPDNLSDEDDHQIDGEEWIMTDKRRRLFGRMYGVIETEIDFNGGLQDRIPIIRHTITNTHQDLEVDVHCGDATREEAGELSELATYLGTLYELDADRHFQAA